MPKRKDAAVIKATLEEMFGHLRNDAAQDKGRKGRKRRKLSSTR